MPILLILTSVFFAAPAWSYPEFIGYKYSSCLTCHFNGNGNGPLNDYGRALWSAEIAGRLFSGNATEDQLGQSSGFLGTTELPWWIRPSIKARELYYRTNPGGVNGTNKSILMQADASVALFLDQDQRKTFVLEYGYAPQPLRLTPSSPRVKSWISREHYFRYQATDTIWIYAGMLDKTYGIRTVDHTAYSRAKTGLAQNDQAHSVILQFVKPKWEWSIDGFVGNLYQKEELRQKGVATIFEYEIAPASRLGVSAIYSNNKYVRNERFAVHERRGLGYGSSLMLEVGTINDIPKAGGASRGAYVYSEAQQKLVRGYHLFVGAQAYKNELTSNADTLFKGSIGVLGFPMGRTEFRFQLDNGRTFTDSTEVATESWVAQAQVHISL